MILTIILLIIFAVILAVSWIKKANEEAKIEAIVAETDKRLHDSVQFWLERMYHYKHLHEETGEEMYLNLSINAEKEYKLALEKLHDWE